MNRRRAAILLGAASALYVAAAWSVTPGFYDGLAPAAPYRWVHPPPTVADNQPPLGGHEVDQVQGGATAPLTAYTNDGQLVISFLPASFRISPGQSVVNVHIEPVADYPKTDFTPVTNVYLVTADAPLAKQAVVQLEYSSLLPAPSFVYQASSGGTWRNIGSSQIAAVFTISTRTSSLGYFAAGYASNSKPPAGAISVGGGQLVPILVAAAILLVLIAGVPLVLLRRPEGDEEGD